MAAGIMISTLGAINASILTGPRVYYAMARQGLFFRFAGRLNRTSVPAWALWIQGIWAMLLVLPRTFTPATGNWGNLYSDLLDYVISSALIFFVLTVAAVFRLRRSRPHVLRPYKVKGYPFLPGAYVITATTILLVLFAYRPATTWPGLAIVLSGLPVYWLFHKVHLGDVTVPPRQKSIAE